MRLKFQSLSLLDHQNMPKPIPHCSNFKRIVGPSRVFFALDQKTSFTKKFSIDPMNLNPGVETAESKICILLPGASEV